MQTNLESFIFQYMSEGMLQINGYGIIVSANEAALDILCLNRDEVIGQRFGIIFAVSEYNDNFVQLIINAMLESESVHDETVTFETRNGIKYLKAVARADIFVEDMSRNALSVTVCFQDISDFVAKNNIEDEIRSLNKVNKALKHRNMLIRRIFGCFVVRQTDDENLLTSELAVKLNEGMQKNVTVLQSDLRGYTAITNRMDPGNMAQMMNHYIDEMSSAVFAHHGSIVEFYGDGIVSAFGAFGHEDTQCEDAVAAAVEMQRKMPAINEWNKLHGFNEYFRMGIGIDCGKAIIGFVGKDNLRTYDVMGSVVGKSDEIQSNTVEGQILISQNMRKNINCSLNIEKEIELYLPHCGENETVSLIRGIGKPYNLKCPVIFSERKKLASPVKIELYIINGKVSGGESVSAEILEISDTEMLIRCAQELRLMVNVEFKIEGSVYAKVTDRDGCLYTISLTNLPPEYNEWKKNIM